MDDTKEIIKKLRIKFPEIKEPKKKIFVMQQQIGKVQLKKLQNCVKCFLL